MKLTRERKMYIAGLGVVLAGLGLSVLIPGADNASDTAVAAPAVATNAPRASIVAAFTKSSEAITFSDQLAQVAGDKRLAPREFPNPLGPECQWLQTKPSIPTAQTPAAAERFLSSHSLSAVLVNGSGSYAMINGRPVRLGATIDGFKLIEVRKSRASLEGNGERIELKLITPE